VPLLAPFSISDDRWKNIEERSGFTIPPDLRRAVVAKTQTLRNRSAIWQSALSIRETIKQIAAAKRTTVDWLKLMDGLPPELEAMIMSLENSDQAEAVIKPIMKGIVVSCDEWLADVASMKRRDGSHPWEIWIVELANLFRQYGLRASARKDVDKNKTGPSPFVVFIRELQQLIEPQYRKAIDTEDADKADEALADAITRARSPRKDKSAASKEVEGERSDTEQATFGGQTTDPPSE
jgi:hypothetical protein